MEKKLEEVLQEAIDIHGKGEIKKAETLYKFILEIDPSHPHANHNLGIIALSLKKPEEALIFFQKALKSKPEIKQFWLSYIKTLLKEKKYSKAEKIIADADSQGIFIAEFKEIDKKLKQLNKEIFEKDHLYYNSMGNIQKKDGQLLDAEKSYKKGIDIKSDFAPLHTNLGNTLQDLGRFNEAEKCHRKALDINPDFTEAYINMGITMHALKRLDEAKKCFKRAISINPNYPDHYNNLGNIYRDLGKFEEAKSYYIKALEVKPNFSQSYNNLGFIYFCHSKYQEAETNYKKAIDLNPNNSTFYYNLGDSLRESGDLEEAEVNYNKAISLKQDFADAYNNKGSVLKLIGRLKEAEESFKKALELNSNLIFAHSNILALQSSNNTDPLIHLNEAKNYGKRVSAKAKKVFSQWNYSKDSNCLNIGFVSADFFNHPVGYFLENILNSIDKSRIKLFAYSNSFKNDDLTEKLKQNFSSWKQISNKTDADTAELIHNDGIQILFDLSGHTAKNRLPVFAYKPAPIQVTWLGYWATTGVAEMDYILGDPYRTPHKDKDHFTETIWQLSETSLCLSEPKGKVDIKPLPALSNGFITFGCFNNLTKMTDEVVKVRADILKAIPESKLFLKNKLIDSHQIYRSVLDRFAEHNISSDRIILEGKTPRKEYFEAYNKIDIALSPFPYAGSTTSIEGLWMGVPVLSLEGNNCVSNVGDLINQNAGLSDWIASDKNEYIEKAKKFASDIESLSKLRNNLRKQVLSSPLYDSDRFTESFQKALWTMWKKWKK